MSVSNRRLKNFFIAEELEDFIEKTSFDPRNKFKNFFIIILVCEDSIDVRDVSVTWDKFDIPLLQNLNLSIQKGNLIAVVGKVGSGKSSLLLSLLGF